MCRLYGMASAVDVMDVDSAQSAARRRHERRLRQFLRHERLNVAMVLSEKKAPHLTRSGWVEMHYTAKEYIFETFVPVPMLGLDAPVPQTIDRLVGVLQILDMSTPVEQVIDIPKNISQDFIPQRAALRVQQLVEQLVDVPVPYFFEC